MTITKKLIQFYIAFGTGLLAIVVIFSAIRVHAEPLGNITEYTVPTSSSQPRSIAEDLQGNMWFTQPSAQKVTKMTKNGTFTEYNTPEPLGHIVRGWDGRMWSLASNYSGEVDAIDSTGNVTKYTPNNPTFGEVVLDIIAGPNNDMWFSVFKDNDLTNVTGFIRSVSTSGEFHQSISVNGRIAGIGTDIENNLIWYTMEELTSTGNSTGRRAIGKIDSNNTKTEYTVPSNVGVLDIKKGPDGNMWFTDPSGKIGKVTNSGVITTYQTPVAQDQPWQIISAADGYLWTTVWGKNKILRISTSGSISEFTIPAPLNENISITSASDNNIWLTQSSNNQIAKLGTGTSAPPVDIDQDGLTSDKEQLQGTSDTEKDTDQDGLNDLVESNFFSGRSSVFCNTTGQTCEYPNPIKKDIYIEVDWMDKPGWFIGYSMKPNSTQVNAIKTAFQNKNILAHIDTGQLGGGNLVTYNASIKFEPQSGTVDFYDYKLGGDGIAAQFKANRNKIYHYTIMGYKYTEAPQSSGASYPGDDDFFISYGLVKDTFQYASLNTAIAGTFIHELGHNLCLTELNNNNPKYNGQPAACRYQGIDSQGGTQYNSSMNYGKQLSLVDYSTGSNGTPNDHDDWSAIRLGDFALSNSGDATHGLNSNNLRLKSNEASSFIVGPTMSQLKNR